MLKFYFVVGEGVSKLTKKNTYGAGLIKNVSKDLKEKLPSLSGLSVTNIGYMKRFYEAFSDSEIHPPTWGRKSIRTDLPQLGGKSESIENIVFLTNALWKCRHVRPMC